MKKLVVVVAVLAAVGAAYAGGAWVVGQQAQSRLQAQTGKLDGQLPGLRIAEQSYERGAFSSTRTVTYTFGCAPAEAKVAEGAAGSLALRASGPVSVTVRDRIRHGPITGAGPGLAVIDSELVFDEEVNARLAKVFGAQAPLRIRTVVGLGGGFTTTVASPPLQTDLEKGEKLDWKGIQGTIRGDAAGKEFTYDLAFPGLELVDPAEGVRLSLAGGRFTGTVRPLEGSLWVSDGRSEGELALLEVSGKQGLDGAPPMNLSLRDLRATSESAVEGGLLGGKARMSATGTFGEVKLEKVELEASLRRFHAASYQKLMSAFMASSCDPEAQKDPTALLASLQGDLGELLRHDPEYSLDRLAVELDGKRGEISYAAGVEGVTAEEASLPPPAILATRGKLRAAARLPVDWVLRFATFLGAKAEKPVPPEQVLAALEQLAAQGMVVVEGEEVRSELLYAGGSLTVNGRPMPLPGAPR